MAKDNTVNETAPEVKTAGPYDPWKDMVNVRLPRGDRNEQNFQFVSVNDRTFQVPKGKDVEVPRPVYEVLANAQAARDYAEDRRQAIHQMEGNG